MNIATINDHRIEIPNDMFAVLAKHNCAGDFDYIEYRSVMIATADIDTLDSIYAGPFYLTHSNDEIAEVSSLNEARAMINEQGPWDFLDGDGNEIVCK